MTKPAVVLTDAQLMMLLAIADSIDKIPHQTRKEDDGDDHTSWFKSLPYNAPPGC